MRKHPLATVSDLCRQVEKLHASSGTPPFMQTCLQTIQEWNNMDRDLPRNAFISDVTRKKDEARHLAAIGGLLEFGSYGTIVNKDLSAAFYEAARLRSPYIAQQVIGALHGKEAAVASLYTLPLKVPKSSRTP